MPTIKTAIVLGYACNNNCRFCYAADKRTEFEPMSTKKAKEILREGKKRGSVFVDFSGGEPTIRRDLPELIEFAKKLGYKKIAITTNGRMLSEKNYCKRLIEAGLNSAVFSIHGHNAILHDYLTNTKGSFQQLVKGFKNFKKLKKDAWICTNTVMLKQNLKFLPSIAKLNIRLGTNAMEFIFPHPKGKAYSNFERLVPRLEQLIDVIPRVLEIGIKAGIAYCHMRYLPLCYMQGYKNHLSEYVARQYVREQHFGPEFKDLNVEKGRSESARVKGPQCYGCKAFDECEGIFKEYAEKRGFNELIPLP